MVRFATNHLFYTIKGLSINCMKRKKMQNKLKPKG